jgi:hypothetical protein
VTNDQVGGEPDPGPPPNGSSTALGILALTLFFNSLALVYGFYSLRKFQDEVRWMMAYVIPARAAAAIPRPGTPATRAPARETVVVYSSFVCPYCRASAAALDSAQRALGDDIAWEYKFLSRPESLDPLAWRAALAGVCSEGAGRLWEFNLRLARLPWGERSVDQAIADVGGGSAEFKNCMAADESEARIWRDIFDAARLGIRETPTVDVGGIRVTGQFSAAPLIALVNERKSRHGSDGQGADQAPATSFR